MIIIDDKLISEDILDEDFVCNLQSCKGVCCVEGDAGAPLEPKERRILEKIYPLVAPYLPRRSRQEIEKQGKWIEAWDGIYETPTVEGRECVYVTFENGMTKCGIEKAFEAGSIEFRKPISCHLYPIRVSKVGDRDALNYERWNICSAACELGKKLSVPVYKFLKDALTRKYGKKFYRKLEEIGEARREEG